MKKGQLSVTREGSPADGPACGGEGTLWIWHLDWILTPIPGVNQPQSGLVRFAPEQISPKGLDGAYHTVRKKQPLTLR